MPPGACNSDPAGGASRSRCGDTGIGGGRTSAGSRHHGLRDGADAERRTATDHGGGESGCPDREQEEGQRNADRSEALGRRDLFAQGERRDEGDREAHHHRDHEHLEAGSDDIAERTLGERRRSIE